MIETRTKLTSVTLKGQFVLLYEMLLLTPVVGETLLDLCFGFALAGSEIGWRRMSKRKAVFSRVVDESGQTEDSSGGLGSKPSTAQEV